jgi:hypothetical protein
MSEVREGMDVNDDAAQPPQDSTSPPDAIYN